MPTFCRVATNLDSRVFQTHTPVAKAEAHAPAPGRREDSVFQLNAQSTLAHAETRLPQSCLSTSNTVIPHMWGSLRLQILICWDMLR
jgi:hypothetical protein